jgi:DNA-binding XRE family transcriptional regulator
MQRALPPVSGVGFSVMLPHLIRDASRLIDHGFPRMARKGSGIIASGIKGRGRIVAINDPIVNMRISATRKVADQTLEEKFNNAGAVELSKALISLKIQQGFGDRLRELRLSKGISQESLALVCHIDRAYIGGVERGERNISLVNIYKIARGLGIPAKDLMP